MRYGSKPEKYRYSKGDPFTIIQTATQYSVTTITLHKVVDGNYPTHPISAEEFEKAVTIQKADQSEDNKSDKQVKDMGEDRDEQKESEQQSILTLIPNEISSEVKEKIDKLSSSVGLERAQAAFDLGEMGTRATSSIPFLIEIIDDDTFKVSLPSRYVEGLGYEITTPGEEAKRALIKIGKLSIKPLIKALDNDNAKIQHRVAEALKEITGEDFGEDINKWQNWWEQNKVKLIKDN